MKKNMIFLFIAAMLAGMLTYLLMGNSDMKPAQITLTSTSFTAGAAMPARYTCDGENISPQFSWHIDNATELKSYLLIVDDPDAQTVAGKTYVHWIVLLPPNVSALPEGISGNGTSSLSTIDPYAKECINDFGNHYYGGPCPPHGTHTYQCTIFALSDSLKTMNTDFFEHPFTAEQCRNHMAQSILAETVITATYARAR